MTFSALEWVEASGSVTTSPKISLDSPKDVRSDID